MKKIGLLTSGGDAPGMNACIRAVVRTAAQHQVDVEGIVGGYDGLVHNQVVSLDAGSVSNIIQLGGTILRSGRSQEFKNMKGRQAAAETVAVNALEGLIVVGGDGTFAGADIFAHEHGIPVIGVPGTIDNDLYGTDFTIGYDTAINTVVQAVDKIRDTANAHNRLFFVEVMGKDAGFIALRSGLAIGAEAILVPETTTYVEALIKKLENDWKRRKESLIIMVAEGDDAGGALRLAEEVGQRFTAYDTRVSILGHLQRGGSPTAMDRVLASRLGHAAVESILQGHHGVMVGLTGRTIETTPFKMAVKHHRKVNQELLDLADILSR